MLRIIRLAGATFVCALAIFAAQAAIADPVTVTASNWKFAPAAITVHVDQPVTLHLTSAAGVHGLESSDLGIPQTTITPGTTKSVTFTPTKIGTYVLHCSIPCGPGHAMMTFTVHVVQ